MKGFFLTLHICVFGVSSLSGSKNPGGEGNVDDADGHATHEEKDVELRDTFTC